ncbi:MAG: hypothetical protein Fur005_06650 [Roseiflexaceae bacterium]
MRLKRAQQQRFLTEVVIGGGNNGTSGGQNMMEGLLAMLLSERMGVALTNNTERPEVAAIREQIMRRLASEQTNQPSSGA